MMNQNTNVFLGHVEEIKKGWTTQLPQRILLDWLVLLALAASHELPFCGRWVKTVSLSA